MLELIYTYNPSLRTYHHILKDCDDNYLRSLLGRIQAEKHNKKVNVDNSDYMLEIDYDDY